MILNIDENWRITSDKYQWILQKPCKITPKNQTGWKNEAFYVSLPALVESLADRMLRASDAATLSEALEEVKSIQRRLSRALTPDYEVTAK